MRHLWFDYRTRMNIELAAAELKIRMNSDYRSEYFYKYLLTQRDMLKDIRVNENMSKKNIVAFNKFELFLYKFCRIYVYV